MHRYEHLRCISLGDYVLLHALPEKLPIPYLRYRSYTPIHYSPFHYQDSPRYSLCSTSLQNFLVVEAADLFINPGGRIDVVISFMLLANTVRIEQRKATLALVT